MTGAPQKLPIEIGLTAAIVAVNNVSGDKPEPTILVARETAPKSATALPSGPFDPVVHRTFEIGLRAWVSEQTGVPLGYVEQLYTFGDRGRHAEVGDRDPHVVSVGYLALTRTGEIAQEAPDATFRSWYTFFPWEDWRNGRPELLDQLLIPKLETWAAQESAPPAGRLSRRERVKILFGTDGAPFDDENVLERYELIYEAGLVEEAHRDGHSKQAMAAIAQLGQTMRHDHRRILATAMGRLRAKMKYRPVIFELMPETFTLTALQRTVEAISGRHLHKQNFRRLVESSAVVEATGEVSHATGGRPAALFRFRREILQERPAAGLRVGART